MEEQRASWATKINYGIGAMGKSLSYGLYGQLERLLRNILHISDKFVIPLFFFEKIWDGVNDLFMGTVIDNTRSKWGKFRPWCAIGAVTNAVMVVATFGVPDFLAQYPVWQFVYVTVFYLLWDMTYTMVDVAYYAMIPALSSSPSERDQFSTIPRLFSGVVGIAGAFIMPIVEWLGGGKDEPALKLGLFRYAIITSVVYVITSVYSAAMTKEPNLQPSAPDQNKPQKKFNIISALRILWGNKQVLVIVGIMILFNMANSLTNGGTGNYIYYVMDSGALQGFFGVLTGAAQGVGLLLFPILGKALGRKKVYAGSLLLPLLGYAALAILLTPSVSHAATPALVAAESSRLFVPMAAMLFIPFIAYGSMSVMQSVMLADAVDYGEYQTGLRNEGIIFSMLTLLSKFSGALSSTISTVSYSVAHFGGSYSNAPTPAAQKSMFFLMYVLPPILLLLAFALYKGAYKLTPERMAQVKADLDARRASLAADIAAES